MASDYLEGFFPGITHVESGYHPQYLFVGLVQEIARSFIRRKAVTSKIAVIKSTILWGSDKRAFDLRLSLGEDFEATVTLTTPGTALEHPWELEKISFYGSRRTYVRALAVYTPQNGLVAIDSLISNEISQFHNRKRHEDGTTWVLLADETLSWWPLPEEVLPYVQARRGQTRTIFGRRVWVTQLWVKEDQLKEVIKLGNPV